jgi:hypothetical protein
MPNTKTEESTTTQQSEISGLIKFRFELLTIYKMPYKENQTKTHRKINIKLFIKHAYNQTIELHVLGVHHCIAIIKNIKVNAKICFGQIVSTGSFLRQEFFQFLVPSIIICRQSHISS